MSFNCHLFFPKKTSASSVHQKPDGRENWAGVGKDMTVSSFGSTAEVNFRTLCIRRSGIIGTVQPVCMPVFQSSRTGIVTPAPEPRSSAVMQKTSLIGYSIVSHSQNIFFSFTVLLHEENTEGIHRDFCFFSFVRILLNPVARAFYPPSLSFFYSNISSCKLDSKFFEEITMSGLYGSLSDLRLSKQSRKKEFI